MRPCTIAPALLLLLIPAALAVPTAEVASCHHLASSVSWQNCSIFGYNDTNDTVKPQCAYYTVPADYHNCAAGNVNLAVVKRPATVKPKLGTLFVNPGEATIFVGLPVSGAHSFYRIFEGGPGGSGTAYVLTDHPELGNITGSSRSMVRQSQKHSQLNAPHTL